jgi:hypothetical protein
MATNANEILDRLAALLDAAMQDVSDPVVVDDSGKKPDYAVSGEWPDLRGLPVEFATFYPEHDAKVYVALRRAAPALIRLARASIATTKGEPISMPEWAAVCHEHSEAIKALGEVRL